MSIEYPCVHYVKKKCEKFSDEEVTSYCVESPCGYQELSNADRIRAMSDEELAEFLCEVYDVDEDNAKFINGYNIPCYNQYSIKEWLEQPAEEGKDEL